MNIIERAEIHGLWESHDLVLDFHRDINFLIGVNGSGKTTVINIIAAALNADFPTLDRMPFLSIKIDLIEVDGKNRPSIEIEKKQREKSPYPIVEYRIRQNQSDKPLTFSLDELEEMRIIRGAPRSYYLRHLQAATRSVADTIKSLVNASWLSIHRTTSPNRMTEERSFESTVDQKLDELSNGFLKFFSSLSKRAADETRGFEQELFLSFIRTQGQALLAPAADLDLSKEKDALIAIFREFSLPERSFSQHIEKHFKLVDQATNKFHSGGNVQTDEIAALVNASRIHSVVQEWYKLVDKQKQIYEPRDTFFKVLNDFLQRKTANISNKNEISIMTQSGKNLHLNDLSSGEKQLVILLGEALLQEKQPWIYIADEPELSLHVKWQEILIDSLRRINPYSQIIVATHSPDIVGPYGNRIFDLEAKLG